MEIEKFIRMVRNPAQTRAELLTILENARSKGLREHADVVAETLSVRFPGWDVAQAKPKQGGKTPNVASFKGVDASFESAREGYVWLIERFISCRPSLFTEPSNETLQIALGKSRNYFAKNPAALFRGSPHLADNDSNFARLGNGWVANVNLNNAQKFDILMRFAALAGVSYPEEWEWRVQGATELLADKQKATLAARKFLEEFFRTFGEPGG